MRIEAAPVDALFDEPVRIRVTDAAAGTEVEISADMEGWTSAATFVADRSGVIDLERDAPIRGSYDGVDAMGLFWSMSGTTTPPWSGSTEPMTVTLAAEDASLVLNRRLLGAGVERHALSERRLRGVLFLPSGSERAPCVLTLTGSGGGVAERLAALFASHGFAALALAYFNYDDLPADLVEIPLEYFEEAIAWMRGHPRIDGSRLAVEGASKGGELALLLGATFPELTAVIATVPGPSAFMGISSTDLAAGFKSSWTWRGEPVPFVPYNPAFAGPWDPPVALTPLYRAAMENTEAMERAAIAVENINGPVLLVSGADDQMWPSAELADIAERRLRDHGRPVEHLRYEGVGHAITSPYSPAITGNAAYEFGGTPKANAAANADWWPKALRFLEESLRPARTG